jgi:hypothetical protein
VVAECSKKRIKNTLKKTRLLQDGFFCAYSFADSFYCDLQLHQPAIALHSSAHFSHINAHSWQWPAWCFPHSFPHSSHMPTQIWHISLAFTLPKLINCAAA